MNCTNSSVFKISKIMSSPVVAAIGLLFLLPLASCADMPGRHPGYLRAISDLRTARGLLMRPDQRNVEGDEIRATREIDACLNDLTRAAWYDGKNLNYRPFPDNGLDWSGKLHKSLDLLRKAHAEMAQEEDDPAAVGLQAGAIKHVDRAIGFTRRAIGDKFDDQFLRL